MKTVIGLFWRDENVKDSIRELKEIGLGEDRIHVMTRDYAVRELLGCDQDHVIAKCAFWGALLGIAVFGPLGLGAGLCECGIFDFGSALGVGILAAFVTIGAAFGAFMGHFVGMDKAERGYHLYCQGVCRGGKVVVVQTSDELVAKAVSTLRHEDALGVTTL